MVCISFFLMIWMYLGQHWGMERLSPFVKCANGMDPHPAGKKKEVSLMQKTPLYKRCLRTLLFVLVLALPLVSLAESYMVVRGGSLNLREYPSLQAKVLGQYPTGTWMTVHSEQDGWSKVTVNGKNGYVMSKYLSDGSSANTLYVRTNTGRGLNLRTEPGLTGTIITSYKPGTAVEVLVRGSDWHKVRVNGTIGYMASQYLTGSASSGSTGSTSGKTGIVTNPGANQVLLLREKASTDSRVLGYYRNGVSVKILGESGSFYKVSVNGQTGYMMKKFITLTSSSTQIATPFTAKLVNPNGNSIVNFRTAPGLNTPIIRAYPIGTQIKVLEMGDVWCKAEIDGVVGYVSRYFFKAI